MRKVAIIGLAPSTHDQAPVGDWECWGLPWDAHFPQYQRGFEMHPMELILKPEARRPRDYLRRLAESDAPIYMQRAYPGIPQAIRYPLDEVIASVGDYFNSSVAYPLALAIHEEVDQIGLWGVDMADEEEYAYQRPNAEYLIGLARGRGIAVYVPPESYLLRFDGNVPLGDLRPRYPKRYGYLD